MKIDYSNYSLQELREARAYIDEEAYPERVKELDSLIKENDILSRVERGPRTYSEEDKYSTFGLRFIASIIDSLLLGALSSGLLYIGSLAGDSAEQVVEFSEYLQYVVYSVALHGLYGQTLGKMAMNVKVVCVNGEGPISFYQAFLRDIVPILTVFMAIVIYIYFSAHTSVSEVPNWALNILFGYAVGLLVWNLLEIVTMLFNKKRRAIHDFIAGTVVIRTDLSN